MTPKLKAAIAERDELLVWMETARLREMELRLFISKQLFPTPKEGVNRLIEPGLEVKMVHKVYHKVDVPAFRQLTPEFRKFGIPIDALVEWDPRLIMKQYKMLDARKKKYFDRALTITEGAPTLTVNA